MTNIPNVIFLNKIISEGQMNYLYSLANVYVSLHKSEGFGLTLAEAMSRGILTIGTGYSGNLDFMTPENSLLINYKKAATPIDDGIYPQYGIWAEPDINHAVQTLKNVYQNFQQYHSMSELGKMQILENFSLKAVSNLISRRLNEIKDEHFRKS